MEKDWTFSHIGIIVKDLDKAMTHYKSIGATAIDGPIDLSPNPGTFKFHGKPPARFKYRRCHLQLGSLEIEMHQPVERDTRGKNIWTNTTKASTISTSMSKM